MTVIIPLLIIIILIVIFIKLIKKPIRLIFKLLLNTATGFIVLIIFNLIGSIFGFSISVSLLHAAVIGILGIPGLIILILLNILI